MSTRLAIALVVFLGLSISSLAQGASIGSPATTTTTATAAPSTASVQVVEFYHKALDHYFITADPTEIEALDSGKVQGWLRTGYQFRAFVGTSAGVNLSPVCRYYGRPEAGLNSHFYSGSPEECAAVYTKFSSSWLFESDNVFKIQMPDPAGSCPASTIPVYRVFNNRSDANHRYTTDVGVRQSMISKGAISEGYGKDGVVFCSDGTDSVDPPVQSPMSVSILATQLAPEMFSFSNSVKVAAGAAVIAYVWNFGDGSTDVGSVVSHEFATPGTYSVLLKVTDDKGNTASAAKVVSAAANPATTPTANPVSPPTPNPTAPSGSNFDTRKSAPGVVRWFDFDTVAQLGVRNGNGANVQYGCGTATCPVIDTTVKASGGGSLRFDVPTKTGDNPAGSWNAEFSPDLSLRFGENSEFYVQWRQRFNQAFVDTKFIEDYGNGTMVPQGGTKQIILGAGNTATKVYNSCEATEVVLTTYYQTKIPVAYNQCGVYAGFYEATGYADYRLQNGTTPYCLYSSAGPNCIRWVANEWMTFKIWIKTGPRNATTNKFDNSEFKLWIARENQPSVLAIWWRPGIPDYFPLSSGEPSDPQSFGKVTLLPYMTNNSATLDHPLAQTWYDELIVSRQDIADPSTAAAAGDLPKWRQNKPVGQWFEIPNTAGMNGAIPAEWAGTVDAWGGFATGPTTWWSAASSGHNEWWNPVVKIDLAADAPKWVLAHASSPQSAVTKAAYYTDGAPTSRHTYSRTQYISGANARDGVDRVMLFGAFAPYAIDYSTQGAYGGGPIVDGFRVADSGWDPAGTWPATPFYASLPSVTKDPRTDDVYYSADYTTARYSPKTNTWTMLQGRPGYSDTGMAAWNYYSSLVDVKRNKLVGLIDGLPYTRPGIVRLERVDLTTNKRDEVLVTGDLKSIQTGHAITHDLDSDRYLYVTVGAVYAINPDTGNTTRLGNVSPPVASEENRAAYFPALGGVAYLPRFASNILFLPTR